MGLWLDSSLCLSFIVDISGRSARFRRFQKSFAMEILLIVDGKNIYHGVFSCSLSVLFFAYAAAVSTINVTKPHMYQPNIKVMFNRVNQH